MNDKQTNLIKEFHRIRAQADAISVPAVDEAKIRADLIARMKKDAEKASENEAIKGCFKNGQRPKKIVIDRYKQTDEYRARYEELLHNDSNYAMILEWESAPQVPDPSGAGAQEMPDFGDSGAPQVPDPSGAFGEMLAKKVRAAQLQARRNARKGAAANMRRVAQQYLGSVSVSKYFRQNRAKVFRKAQEAIEDFIREDLTSLVIPVAKDDRMIFGYEPLSAENWDFAFDAGFTFILEEISTQLGRAGIGIPYALVVSVATDDPFIAELMASEDTGDFTADRLHRLAEGVTHDQNELQVLGKRFTRRRVQELLAENPHFADLIAWVRETQARREHIRSGILEEIPAHYPDLFPLAREMKRRFIIHIGPTNSGKTYDAIEALKNAESGVYLAPLRLLAYEQYENLNRAGAVCTLVTGEERRVVPGAWIRSSTIEMLDFKQWYDVAVIDEAQMMTDLSRGGAWTAALMGVREEEIHVCAAPSAKNLLIRLIGECGDTFSVQYHERKTPLIFEKKEFHFPKSVRPGDALIVFSRKDVHAVAAELQREGRKCSIIYGALPYDVRYEEAGKFREGENDIVVATDAIGMGLNMPVRRIVFLQEEKFDGREKRPLLAGEIQQIAGRAGRIGIYDEGYVNALYDRDEIEDALYRTLPDDEEAVIAFPEELLRIDAPLSEIMKQWASMEVIEGFRRDLSETEIMLAQQLEEISDDKYLIYRFVTMAFDEGNAELLAIWREMFEYESGMLTFPYEQYLPVKIPSSGSADDLPKLEAAFHVCDLLYAYMDRFDHPDGIQDVLNCKQNLSEAIMKILDKQELGSRKCRECGRPLPWIYPYGICDHCFRRKQRIRR